MTNRLLIAITLLLWGGRARADTVVLTPHVQGSVIPEARQLARRIGDMLRRYAATQVRTTETRTLPTLGESMQCDAETTECLQRIADTLSSEELISGELEWSQFSLTLQLYRRDQSGQVRRIAETILPDLLGDWFDAWIQHLVRRLRGQHEGIVVVRSRGALPREVRLRIGHELVTPDMPVFLAVGRYALSLEKYGERRGLGNVDVVDGQRTERQVGSPPTPGAAGCCPQQRGAGQLPIALGVVIVLRRRRRAPVA